MLTPAQYQRALHSFPLLQRADPGLARTFQADATYLRIPPGHDIFAVGDRVESIALLLSGVVRVYLIGTTGREITLYRFGLGESCILTANAILNEQDFPALATVEEPTEALLVPAPRFRAWVRESDLWRDFLFDLLSQRLLSMMTLVDEVAFHRMDSRLAAFLLAQEQQPVCLTHQEIADELGSSREVISRLLADFAQQGTVRVGRGELTVLDSDALRGRTLV